MVTLNNIREAQARLNGIAVRTKLLEPHIHENGEADKRKLFLKPENQQPIGAFKLRGAYNKVASLPPQERQHGVITYSSGNHAQGVAYAARAMGVKCVVVMPNNAPATKREATKALGAEIVVVGPGSKERQLKAEELAAQHGYAIIPPYNDEKIIAGQGTIGLEILEDLPDVECVLAPVGGGGLSSGIATAIKLSNPKIKMIGVEPELAGDCFASFHKGEIVEFPAEQVSRTIADGLRTNVGEPNFAIIQRYVDEIVTVSEEAIVSAMRTVWETMKIVIEPSAAVPYAAIVEKKIDVSGKRVGIILTGGNIDLEALRWNL